MQLGARLLATRILTYFFQANVGLKAPEKSAALGM